MTIQYVATGRAIASANPVYLHLGWNNWNPVVSPDPAMTFNSASNAWQYTVPVPANATTLNCVFNNGSGTWDNNNGANWNFSVSANNGSQPPSPPQNLIAIPVQTNRINLSWSASAGASGYQLNRDNSPLAATILTTFSDSGLAANSSHCYSVIASNSAGFSAASATVCTNTPANPPFVVPGFTLDGAFDSAGYQLASNSLVLEAAVRGTTLYVATGSTGSGGPNDYFIFVSDQLLPAATAAAPWAKAGTVAVSASKPFLAGESQNGYLSWFVGNAAVGWPCAKSAATSGALEGTLDLVAAFGAVPTNLYLCVAAYQTADGGALVAQCPSGSGPNLDANEFLEIPVASLRDSLGNGTFDACDPARGFKILSAGLSANACGFKWAAMPGRAYQVQFASHLGGAWSNLPAGSISAGTLQTELNFTDAPPMTAAQRFYRIKLLP